MFCFQDRHVAFVFCVAMGGGGGWVLVFLEYLCVRGPVVIVRVNDSAFVLI